MEGSLNDRDRVGVQDAVLLEDYTNPDVYIENLEKRFNENLIYTYIGQVLVSVNPYKPLDIYSAKDATAYQNIHFFEAPPHVFALTDSAYRSLKEENRDQCILISGESGSGKTEASKKVLQYIADVTDRKGEVEKVKNKLLQSNPVLEAFGNAKTFRNDNSSRFGKYMDIEFNFEGYPVAGNILNYLLEKSRVINQVQEERNFHIFYQVIAGASDEQLEEFCLKRNLGAYSYLKHGDKSNVENINDKASFNEVWKALTIIEFTEAEQKDMLKIIASILHLGNITFTEEDGRAAMVKSEASNSVCKLLGCDEEEFLQAMTHRTREAKGDIVTSPLDKATAIYARDALAKAIYDRLFTWLVSRINISLQPTDNRKHAVMGILDIYGFEVFKTNSFEQLCINFCNEKLQQLFIELTLKSEQEEYQREGIEWNSIPFFDNKIICDLIEEKHKGIIALMDEECLRPGITNDMTLIEKMNKNLHEHIHYLSHQKADIQLQKTMGRDEFQLKHYAGVVTYNVHSFIEKNNDLLFRDLRDVMSHASNTIINAIFPTKEQESKKRPETAITQFKNSVNNLMEILMNKEPNYIRCIKPNDDKRPGFFEHTLVKHQVTYLGLMENLRVRRAGFAYRRTYELFLERYKSLSDETWPNYNGTVKDGVQVLVNKLGYQKDEYRMGTTKIFIRLPKTLFHTEDAFQARKHAIVAIIQANWRGLLQRRAYMRLRLSSIIVQKWFRRFQAKREAVRRKNAVETIRKFIKGYITRNDPEDECNSAFMKVAKFQWLNRLAKNLPKNLLDKQWPACPHTAKHASELLQHYHRCHMSKTYRKNLSNDMKNQLELKVLAEKIFKLNGNKKSYRASVPHWFKDERVPQELLAVHQSFTIGLSGEKVKYSTTVCKFDRHGYKPRDRMIIVTNANIYLIETKGGSITQKHQLPLKQMHLLVTSENDKMLMIVIPDELVKTDKGDLILEVPHLIECVTKITAAAKKENMCSVDDKKVIEHKMKGKSGIIDVTIGNPGSIQKDKSGHLLITASP